MNKEEKWDTPQYSIIGQLIELLIKEYSPTGNPGDMDLKSTLDIVEEMGPIADVTKNEISEALVKEGFRLKYTEAGVYWKLYRKTSETLTT